MRKKIEVKVSALADGSGSDFDGEEVTAIVDLRKCVYNERFIERWARFLLLYSSMADPEGIEPSNSPHDYDAWDFYRKEFSQGELDYISDNFMPQGDPDWGCGQITSISLIENGSETLLYE